MSIQLRNFLNCSALNSKAPEDITPLDPALTPFSDSEVVQLVGISAERFRLLDKAGVIDRGVASWFRDSRRFRWLGIFDVFQLVVLQKFSPVFASIESRYAVAKASADAVSELIWLDCCACKSSFLASYVEYIDGEIVSYVESVLSKDNLFLDGSRFLASESLKEWNRLIDRVGRLTEIDCDELRFL